MKIYNEAKDKSIRLFHKDSTQTTVTGQEWDWVEITTTESGFGLLIYNKSCDTACWYNLNELLYFLLD